MTLGNVYFACFIAGIVFAVFQWLFSHLGGDHAGDYSSDSSAGGHAGADHSIDHGEAHVTPISPNVLAAFLTCFGAGGMISTWALGYGLIRSLVVALPCGFIFAAVFYYAIKLLFSVTQASSEAKVADLIGEMAEVSVPITEDSVGEIVYAWLGTRYMAPAKSSDGKPIERGQKVIIEKVESGIYTVRRI